MREHRGLTVGLLTLFNGAGLAAAGFLSPLHIAAGLAGLFALSSVLGPVIGVHWLVLSLPFQDLGIDLGVSIFSPVDAVVYLVILSLIWEYLIRSGRTIGSWGPLGLLAISGLFFIPSLFSAPIFAKGLKDMIRLAVAIGTALIALEAVRRSSDPPQLVRRILGLFALTGLLLAVILFDQIVAGGGIRHIQRLVLERGRSLFIDPNYFASYMVMTLSCALGLLLQVRGWLGRLFWFGVFLVILGAIGLSLSRASYLAVFFLVLISIIYVWRSRAQIARLSSLVLIVLVLSVGSGIVFWRNYSDTFDPGIASRRLELLFSGRDSSVRKRALILQGAARMVERHPITGVGLAQFEAVYDSYKVPGPFASYEAACHNTPLRLLAETGLVGFVPFTIAFLVVLGRIFGGFRSVGKFGLSPLYFGMVGGILTFGLMALTLDQLFKFHLWMIVGLALGLSEWARNEISGE
jgi:O-antigen ligase